MTATLEAPPPSIGDLAPVPPRVIPQAISLVLLVVGDPDSAAWTVLCRFLDRCARRGLSCLAISPEPRASLDAWLARQGCAGCMPLRICGPEMTVPLPDPAALLLAGQRLSCGPAHCLVVSDVPEGMEAALAAGCPAIDLGQPVAPDGWVPNEIHTLSNLLRSLHEDGDALG